MKINWKAVSSWVTWVLAIILVVGSAGALVESWLESASERDLWEWRAENWRRIACDVEAAELPDSVQCYRQFFVSSVKFCAADDGRLYRVPDPPTGPMVGPDWFSGLNY